MSCWETITSASSFRFMGGRWIPVAWSVIFAFLLMATFYLRKTEKETAT